MDKYLTNEDIKEILSALNLDRSGSRPESLGRLLKATEGMPVKKVLSFFPSDALSRICKANGIERQSIFGLFSDTDDEMVRKICSQVLDKEGPKLDGRSMKLFELVKDRITRDELQTILGNLKLPISGNKEELLVRLLQSSSTWNVEDILSLFSREVLASMSTTIGLPPKKAKRDMIDAIAQKEFGITPKERKVEKDDSKRLKRISLEEEAISQKTPKRPIIRETERVIGEREVLLWEILDRDVNKDAIKSALSKLDEPISGNKDELVERLLEATDYDPRTLLTTLDGFSLNDIAERNEIKKRRSKEDQINELMQALFGAPKLEKFVVPKIANHYLPELQQTESSIQGKEVTFNGLIELINQWTPSNSYPHESGYQGELATWLTAKGLKTRQRKGDTEVDILVNDEFPIEMKKEPRLGEYDRALGQIIRHYDSYGCIILVVCDIKRKDQFEDFEDRVHRKLVDTRHVVIKK